MPVVRGHGPQTVDDVLDRDVGECVWEAGGGGDGPDGGAGGGAGGIGGCGGGRGGGQLKGLLSWGERVGHHAGVGRALVGYEGGLGRTWSASLCTGPLGESDRVQSTALAL